MNIDFVGGEFIPPNVVSGDSFPPAPVLKESKLYLVTHAGLSAGYQTAQTAHVVADFILANPEVAALWHKVSNYIIVLEADSLEHLLQLREKATCDGLDVVSFVEPDLCNEVTALAFIPHEGVSSLLTGLPLVGKNLGDQKLLKQRERRLRRLSEKPVLAAGK